MKRVGIVGAGISGLVLASFLKKSKKYEISIFEKNIVKSRNINGIQISPNAIKILKELNFDSFNKDKFCKIQSLSFYDCISNIKIATMNLDYLKKDYYVTLNRDSLVQFLINEFDLKNNITEKEAIKIYNRTISFKDQTKQNFDILVIADGIFSKLRYKKIHPIYSGYSAFRGTFSDSKNSNMIDLYMGNNFHLVKYPIDQNCNYSFTLVKKAQLNDQISDYNSEIKDFNTNYKSFLSNLDNNFSNNLKVKIWPIYKLNKIYYGHEKTFFIGDSSHGFIPSRAQGAAQAIEDAYILFNLIQKNKILADSLYQIRNTRIKKIISKSENNIIIFHQSFFIFRWIRNLFIRLICVSKFLTKLINSFIFNYDFKKGL
ncbi:MAG: hypothetical protein CMI73_02185 [Candidatus Pelagibacter sp.]|nr:hypothetical protein [Candidatus Pelagibacter sp.]OUV87703.1 MAG: hypothetical protein CBC96_01585 [Pelagibacteraceae bacterium TMED136]|tara:strand:+ start:33448 stop:34566 length:1119 start_codon:yes stop_codon:yes gene_type:complete